MDYYGHAGHAAAGRIAIRIACRPLRPANPLDGQRDLFFDYRAGLRVCAQFYGVPGFAGAVRDWHGRRVGGRCFAGDGISSDQVARNFEWNFAEWLFDRLFTGGDCRTIFVAALGMAADVLDRRVARASGAVYKKQSSGVRSVEATPRGFYRGSVASGCRVVAKISVSGPADDVHDIPVARNAGFVSGLPGRSAQNIRNRSREYRDDL